MPRLQQYRSYKIYGGPTTRLRVRILRLAYALGRITSYRLVEYLSRLLFSRASSSSADVQIHGGFVNVPLSDTYWLPLLLDSNWVYEPEITSLLSGLDGDAVFLDCGANIGYWSLSAAAKLGNDRVLAVEASSSTYRRLIHNRNLSGRSFECLQLAVFDESGLQLQLLTPAGEHAGAHVDAVSGVSPRPIESSQSVTTVTIADLVGRLPRSRSQLLIKLDVEGAEVRALAGAESVLDSDDVILVYEDHGSDRASLVTRYVLDVLKMKVCVADSSGAWRPIESADDLARYKTNPNRGYNCVGTQGSRQS